MKTSKQFQKTKTEKLFAIKNHNYENRKLI